MAERRALVDAALDRRLPPAERTAADDPRGHALQRVCGREATSPHAGAVRLRGRGRDAGGRHAGGGGAGADPHVLAGPRRPAGHGRRRFPAGPADLSQGLWRGRRRSGGGCTAHSRLPGADRPDRHGRPRGAASADHRRDQRRRRQPGHGRRTDHGYPGRGEGAGPAPRFSRSIPRRRAR